MTTVWETSRTLDSGTKMELVFAVDENSSYAFQFKSSSGHNFSFSAEDVTFLLHTLPNACEVLQQEISARPYDIPQNKPVAVQAGKRWSDEDITVLTQEYAAETKLLTIANKLGRSENAIILKLMDLGIAVLERVQQPTQKIAFRNIK